MKKPVGGDGESLRESGEARAISLCFFFLIIGSLSKGG